MLLKVKAVFLLKVVFFKRFIGRLSIGKYSCQTSTQEPQTFHFYVMITYLI